MLSDRRLLPRLQTLDDAVAVCDQERDDFFLDAYLIQNWISEVRVQAETEYRGRSGHRVLQAGQAQCAFLRVFGNGREADLQLLYHNLYRFAEYGDTSAQVLASAVRPLSIEHEMSGDFVPGRAPDPLARPFEALALRRISLERWCDWIDAVIHLEIHARWHLQRETFLPAAEARKTRSRTNSMWLFAEVDEAVICLWPLVKRHNWSYADLRNVIRDVLRQPNVHPCRDEQAFANYCTHTLGLHKTGCGQTVPNNIRPAGYETALKLCPALRIRSQPGRLTWD